MRGWRLVWIFLVGWIVLVVDKSKMLKVINYSLPFTDAGLLSGIILGDKESLGKVFKQELIDSGLIHLVVVSGSNVMLLIGGVIESLASWVGRKWAIVGGTILGWKYVILVGWEVPVLRAMLLMSIIYFGQLLGRKFNLVRGLGLAILMMIIGEPRVIISVSFWLSIMAFLGVITAKSVGLATKRQKSIFKTFKIFDGLIMVIAETVWIMIWITPILAIVFGEISLVSPLTNILVLGLVGVVSVVGAIGIAVGLWWLPLGKMVLWLTIPTLSYLRKVAEWGGGGGMLQIEFNWWMLVGYYLILGYWLIRQRQKLVA